MNRLPEAEIRAAQIRDLPQLLAIEQGVFAGDRLSARSLRRHVQNRSAAMLLASLGEIVCGYVLLFFRRNSNVARIYSLGIGLEHHGRGFGARLLHECENVARARGCDVLRLEVRRDNQRAIALYERVGFCRIGERPNYYSDGETAFRYEKNLAGHGKDGSN